MNKWAEITRGNHINTIVIVFILLLSFLTYFSGLGNLFVADDYYHLPNQSFQAVFEQLKTDLRLRMAILPLDWLIFQVAGFSPVVMHLLILIVHILNTWLVFKITSGICDVCRIGWLASLLFTLYPRNQQAVLWWAAHHMVIGTFFVLLGLLFFVQYLRTSRRYLLVISFLSLFSSVLFSESGIFLIAFLPTVELTINYDGKWRDFIGNTRGLFKYIPYVLIPLFYIALSLVLLGSNVLPKILASSPAIVGDSDYHLNPVSFSMIKDGLAYLTYLILPLVPLRSLDPNMATMVLSGSILLACTIIFLTGRPFIRLVSTWIGLAILPFILFVQSGNADRYFYLASVGIAILFGQLFWILFDKAAERWLLRAGLALILIVFSISSIACTQFFISEWRESGRQFNRFVQFAREKIGDNEDVNIVMVDFPDYYGRVYQFIGNGIIRAIQRDHYTGQLKITKTNDALVVNFLNTGIQSDDYIPGKFVFMYKNGEFLDLSGYYSALIQKFPRLNEP